MTILSKISIINKAFLKSTKKIKKNILYHESMRIKFTFELSSFFKLLPTTIGDEL